MPKSPCSACKVGGASVSAFDKHRVGSFGKPLYDERKRFIGYSPHERRWLTEGEMVAAGMSKNQRGLWITEVPDASALLRLKGKKVKEPAR